MLFSRALAVLVVALFLAGCPEAFLAIDAASAAKDAAGIGKTADSSPDNPTTGRIQRVAYCHNQAGDFAYQTVVGMCADGELSLTAAEYATVIGNRRNK